MTKYCLLQGRKEKRAKSFIIAVKGLVFGGFIAPTSGGGGQSVQDTMLG